MNIPEVSVRRAVTLSMLFIIIAGFGVFNFMQLKLDLYPDIDFPMVVVMTTYVGANPEDIETLVTRPIEESVASVTGIKEISSTSSQSVSIVMVEFNWGYDMDKAEQDVQKYVNMVAASLPDDAQEPVAFAFDPSMQPIIMFGVKGNYTPAELRYIAEERIEPFLERAEGIAEASTIGGLERQVNVNLDIERMRAMGFGVAGIIGAIQAANRQLPGGSMDNGQKDYSIYTEGQFRSTEEIEKTVVGSRNGRIITLKDIAEVEDGFVEVENYARNNGEDVVMVMVRRQSDANTVQAANNVKKRLASLKNTLPDSIEIVTIFDQSDIINTTIANLGDTAWQAILTVVLVLIFFMGSIRSSIVVGVSIPISMLVAFAAMGQMNVTLNMMSLSGLSLAIGMLVDNSIVVVENIYRHFKTRDIDAKQAAVDGTSEVYMAVGASTLTTLVVFVPILFVPGIAGEMFRDMCIVICVSLLGSLLVAVTLIPMLTSRILGKRHAPGEVRKKSSLFKRLIATTSGWIESLANLYGRFMTVALGHKALTLFVTALLFVGSIFMTIAFLDMDFMGQMDQGNIIVSYNVKKGTQLEDFNAKVKEVEAAIRRAAPEAININARFGVQDGFGALNGVSASAGNIRVKLPKRSQRARSQREIEDEIYRQVADITGIEVKITKQGMGNSADINLRIFCDDLDKLKQVGTELKYTLEKVPSIEFMTFSLEEGEPQFNIKLDRERLKNIGITPSEVAVSVSAYFQGMKAGTMRDSGDEWDILVRASKADRDRETTLPELPLVAPTGKVLPLRAVAELEETIAPSQIQRFNQQRMASIDITKKSDYTLGVVTKAVQEVIDSLPQDNDVMYEVAGSAEDMQDSFKFLGLAIVVAIFLVYAVMASQFESLLEPFVILFTMPLTWIGVVVMLVLTHTTLQITALVGLIILVGIVVNNGIVLVDYIKQLLEKGMNLVDAAAEAARSRLRPVLMTAATTILAMIPLALELGEGSELWSPMARTVIGGLTVSTFLTLLVIPTVYVLLLSFLHRKEPQYRGTPLKN